LHDSRKLLETLLPLRCYYCCTHRRAFTTRKADESTRRDSHTPAAADERDDAVYHLPWQASIEMDDGDRRFSRMLS